jgi:hypothetical protein
MSSRKCAGRIKPVALLALLLAAGACNLLEARYAEVPSTPNIIYVTATPEGYVAPLVGATPTGPLIGPFQHTLVPTGEGGLAPTLDLSDVTLFPTPEGGTPGTATPTGELPTVTLTPTVLTPLPTLTPTATPPPGAGYAPLLGINFISSAQHPADKARVRTGLEAGASWDRFAIYWSEIEEEPGEYDWDLYDRTVHVDVKNGLRTDAILLGVPRHRADNRGVPEHLHEPVFADGTDKPGGGKKINPDNPWAKFVYAAVARYKPGGKLAGQKGWAIDQGVRVWEVWNEPDFQQFWAGSVDEYARLLKVAYLAARHADPEAQIMVGGLVLFEQPYFFANLLGTFKNDPNPVAGTYPFDMVAVHSYSHPPYTFHIVQTIESLLAIYGLGDVAIWLNESGVAVWDDYPGPEWATRDDQIVWRATQEEQASYVIQNAAYAFMAGAEAVFHFQLYDDCGNQPAGTTFAPHDGDLCQSGSVCWGDALGLMRNARDNTCFNQHPQPDTPRPAYEAFRTVGEIFGEVDFVPLTAFPAGPSGAQRWLIFARPATSEIVTLIWSESGQVEEAVVQARSEDATLVTRSGERTRVEPDEDGSYHILLDPATNHNQVGMPASVKFMIGGTPIILIEKTPRPVVSVLPLLDDSANAFLVKWRSSDPSVGLYQIWYRDNTSGGDWVLWLEADEPGDALFVGGGGRMYSFFARGMAADGEWTGEEPVVQAWTRVWD